MVVLLLVVLLLAVLLLVVLRSLVAAGAARRQWQKGTVTETHVCVSGVICIQVVIVEPGRRRAVHKNHLL